MVRLTSRPFLIRVMNFLQYPRVYASPKLGLFASNILTHVSKIRRSAPPAMQESKVLNNLNQFRNILLKAQEKYFSRVNVFLGLFPENTFYLFPRSCMLRAAIFLCGLQWCQEDHNFKEAEECLISILKDAITPSNIPFTLDSLQTLLILLVAMFHSPWFSIRSGFLLTFALRLAYAIGLHLPSTCLYGELERQLARNCLLYHVNYLSVSGVPVFTHLPKLALPVNDWTLFYALGLDSLNRVFTLFQETKLSIVEGNPQPLLSDIHCRLDRLDTRLTSVSLKFMTALYQHLASYPESPRFLRILVPLFSFYITYYRFLITSMRLYRATNKFLPAIHPHPTHKTLLLTLDICKQAVTWALNTKCSYLHWYFYAKLAQCLVFMSRHQKLLSPEEEKLLKRGKDTLKSRPSSPQIDAILKNMRFMKKLEFFDNEFYENP
ncbi:hypothetical protein DSO57_1012002 [Entomophthora muscae]|uniref:Uncharacterized protein n=1 Tax=Entomophthora muscae TaxID=34485 RepID=A0ACC2UEY1_9FUNG|nr:hypothetical protein DSO57_1012002 [Entomophthora muscae]